MVRVSRRKVSDIWRNEVYSFLWVFFFFSFILKCYVAHVRAVCSYCFSSLAFVRAGESKDKEEKADNLEGCSMLKHYSSGCNRWPK